VNKVAASRKKSRVKVRISTLYKFTVKITHEEHKGIISRGQFFKTLVNTGFFAFFIWKNLVMMSEAHKFGAFIIQNIRK